MPESKTSAAERQAPPPKTNPAEQQERQAKSGDRLPDDQDTEPTGPEPGVYEYTHSADCVYPNVPLTARAEHPGRPADPNDQGDEGEDAVAATVFDWPFGPPDDGRWTKTRKKPNQAADNAPAPSSEE
jgi:hypothetical protein